MTFDDHRAVCHRCNTKPYDLCPDGANLLIREEDRPGPSPLMRGGMNTREIAALVARIRRDERCKACGAELVVHRAPGTDLDIVCPKRLEPPREEAMRHFLFPIDTGPFSLGRRVD